MASTKIHLSAHTLLLSPLTLLAIPGHVAGVEVVRHVGQLEEGPGEERERREVKQTKMRYFRPLRCLALRQGRKHGNPSHTTHRVARRAQPPKRNKNGEARARKGEKNTLREEAPASPVACTAVNATPSVLQETTACVDRCAKAFFLLFFPYNKRVSIVGGCRVDVAQNNFLSSKSGFEEARTTRSLEPLIIMAIRFQEGEE
jgi:hypothetical protein